MDYKEFVTEVCKKRGPKGKFKIRNSWGVYDAYKSIRKNSWKGIGKPVKEHTFYTIVKSINKLLAEEVVNGRDIKFPHYMGSLRLQKLKMGVSIVGGKMKINYPVNWGETYKLWYEDEEARKNKTLLRFNNPHTFKITYSKKDAVFENKVFYAFAVARSIKEKLKDNIIQGKIETLW